jgi:hypothetical protein
MPTPKKGDKKPPKGNEEQREGGGKQERPPRLGNPDADPVKIHREYVERRVGRGGPATPEAYARALEQWHKLPGAVSTPPTEVRADDAQSLPKEGEGAESKDTGRDTKRGS